MTEQDAEKVMKFWLAKSGFERWELFEGCILFQKRECPPVHLVSWEIDRFYADGIMFKNSIMFKNKRATCRDIVQRCLDKCVKGLEIYVVDSEQTKVIVLLKPFQSLEELLIETDLFFDTGDALDDVG